MLRRVIRRPAAIRDLSDYFAYIGQDSEESATRFLKAAEQTFLELAGMPGMGIVTSFSDFGDRNLRRWRIRGFENFLIFGKLHFQITDRGLLERAHPQLPVVCYDEKT